MGVQLKHIDFTLSGASQNIGASLTDAQLAILAGGGTAGTTAVTNLKNKGLTTAQIAEAFSFKSITIQQDAGNTHVTYLGGGGQTVTSSSYGIILPAPASSVPAAPLLYPEQGGVVMRLGDFTVLGTANEVLHLFLQDW